MLCDDCERFRFPDLAPSKPLAKPASGISAPKSMASMQDSTRSQRKGKSTTDAQAVTRASHAGHSINGPEPPRQDLVVSELLMYVNCFRDRAAEDGLKKVLTAFYTAGEIADAKKQIVAVGGSALADCEFITERRNSAQRAASDAEVEDIIALFDVLDRLDLLQNVKFVAAAYDRLPSYGPEELNVCAVVDKQKQTDCRLAELSAKVDLLASSKLSTTAGVSNVDAQSIVASLGEQLKAATSALQDQMSQLVTACSLSVSPARKPTTQPAAAVQTFPTRTSSPPPDRSRNIIISGIAENRDDKVWRAAVVDVLQIAAGREVQIGDAFRLGGRYTANKTRPLLVKLHSAWDRRIILSGARNLAGVDRFRRVFLSADEAPEVRRRNILERLKNKAARDGKSVEVINGVLTIRWGHCLFT